MAKTKIVGKVVKKFDKTATVVKEYKMTHPKYLKAARKTRKFLVQDGQDVAEVGMVVEIVETRPVSKNKHFEIVRIIETK